MFKDIFFISWRQIISNEDPNISYDICDIANIIIKDHQGDINLPDIRISKEQVVKIVELVETNLLRKSPGNAVRHLESEALCKILNELYDIIKLFCESENIQLGDKEETLSKSLYMWHGCLNMDKLCRKKDILGEVITEQYRIEIHNWLVELSQSNIWIGKGFRAAEKFRLDQKNDKEYDWIPKDSPYYQSM